MREGKAAGQLLGSGTRHLNGWEEATPAGIAERIHLSVANRRLNGCKGSAESNHKPWVWYMSEACMPRVLEFIDEVLDAAGQHIRLHYVPVGAADHEGAEPESFKP